MSFLLPETGPLNLNQLQQFHQTNAGSLGSLKNQGTPAAQDFQKRLTAFQGLTNEIGQNAWRNGGQLTPGQAKQVRDAASGISDSRLAAQKSQMLTDAPQKVAPANGAAAQSDPYKDSQGKMYRPGASQEELRTGKKSLTEGDRSDGVKTFQEQLKRAGYDLGPKGADGFFGPKTAAAAKQFMEKYPDLKDGINSKALERASGAAEGANSGRVGDLIHNGIDNDYGKTPQQNQLPQQKPAECIKQPVQGKTVVPPDERLLI